MNTPNFTSITGENTLRPFIIKSAIIALSLTVISDMALARVPSTTALPNNWTGAYGGINIGGVFNDANLKSNNLGFIGLSSTCNMNSNFSSFFSGVQAGYAYQFDSKVVLGVEGDYTYNSSQTGRAKCPCPFTPGVSDGFSFKNRQQGSVRGRIGYALNHNLLPFLSAGDSFADLGMNYLNEAGDHY
jgi:outer membrane immunogenic protein